MLFLHEHTFHFSGIIANTADAAAADQRVVAVVCQEKSMARREQLGRVGNGFGCHIFGVDGDAAYGLEFWKDVAEVVREDVAKRIHIRERFDKFEPVCHAAESV